MTAELNKLIQDSALYKSCCVKLTAIRHFLGTVVNSASAKIGGADVMKTSPMVRSSDSDDISWFALLLVVPLSLLGLMLGMTHHVLLFLAAMCENVLRSWCSQWTSFKQSHPQPEQYMFFCLVSAPVMMVLASAWIALYACCHLNKFFLSNVPEDFNNFVNSKLLN